MKKKKQDMTKNYMVAIGVFVLAVGISLCLFFIAAQKTIDISSREETMSNVSKQSEHLRMILDIHFSYMEGIAKMIGEGDDLLSDKNKKLIRTIKEGTDLDHLALIDANGNAYYDNGVKKNVVHRWYFREGIKGNRTLSDPLESSVDQETRVVLSVPVYDKDQEKVIGVFGGSYNVSALSHMLFSDLFDSEGYSMIVTKEGKVIANDGDAKNCRLSYGDNIIEFCKSREIKDGHSTQSVKRDFSIGKEGVIRAGGYEDGSERYLAYAPLGMNDWMICYAIPASSAQESYSFIEQYEMILLGCFGILVCILLLYVIRKNRQKTAEILRSAQIDELTQIYNRKYAEQYAEQILEETQDCSLHAFFIMDIDKFKEVNDIYGHAVGDEVLHRFGQLLGRQFRTDDVVGRIGGDEFIVLMRNINTKEAVRAKAEQLLKEVGKLRFEQMDGNGITISVGIALFPEYGENYMNLYRSADHALYQTKRNGRDGFTICGEE